MVDARFAVADVGPNDLFVARDLEQPDFSRSRVIGGDDRVAVRKSLRAAGIVEWLRWKIVIRDLPDRLTRRIDFNTQVADCAVDQRVAIVQADRGEGPVRRRDFPDNFAVGLVLADHLVEQLRHEVVPVLQFASHPRLQVMILRLSLQRHLDRDLAVACHFEQPRFVSRLRHQDVAVLQSLRRVDLGLRPLELEDRLAFASHLDHRAAIVRLRQRQQNISVGQNPAVASRLRIRPRHLAIAIDDVGLTTGREERMRDRRHIGRANKTAFSDQTNDGGDERDPSKHK